MAGSSCASAGAALRARATVVMGIVTIAIVTLVDTYHLPLVRRDGTMIEVPRLFEFGFWLAIVIGVVFLGLAEADRQDGFFLFVFKRPAGIRHSPPGVYH